MEHVRTDYPTQRQKPPSTQSEGVLSSQSSDSSPPHGEEDCHFEKQSRSVGMGTEKRPPAWKAWEKPEEEPAGRQSFPLLRLSKGSGSLGAFPDFRLASPRLHLKQPRKCLEGWRHVSPFWEDGMDRDYHAVFRHVGTHGEGKAYLLWPLSCLLLGNVMCIKTNIEIYRQKCIRVCVHAYIHI